MRQTKRMVIPLTHDREIWMSFTYSEQTGLWVARCTDEAMQDIEEFWRTGYYQLDPTRQVEIK